jgi:hypothetical protein
MTGRRSRNKNGSMSLTLDGKQIALDGEQKLNFKQYVDTALKKMAKKSWFPWKNTTKTHQNCKDNPLQQYYFTTPGLLLHDSLSLKRRGFSTKKILLCFMKF